MDKIIKRLLDACSKYYMTSSGFMGIFSKTDPLKLKKMRCQGIIYDQDDNKFIKKTSRHKKMEQAAKAAYKLIQHIHNKNNRINLYFIVEITGE